MDARSVSTKQMRESSASENDYNILFCLVPKVHTQIPTIFSTNLTGSS